MATNNYSKESISFGSNEQIPSNLKGENVITDDLLNGMGIYSKRDIEEAKFKRFSRFGRVLDPYGRVNAGREYLFFVKPDLHICIPYGHTEDETLYTMAGASFGTPYKSPSGLRLNPQLNNHPYFRELIDTHPNVVKDLQFSAAGDGDPFSRLLSFTVNSNLPLGSSSAETMDNPSTIFGNTYKYLQDSEASDNGYSFSLEFVDNKYLDTYHFFKAYSDYHIARKSGLVTPPTMDYYQYKRLHNTMGVYKFIVAEDMETIIYWAYLWGLYPTSCPREAFQDPSFSDGLTFSVDFEAAFIEDMNPMILHQFNQLMLPVLSRNGCTKDNWLPVVRQNRSNDKLDGINGYHSYDPSESMGGREATINGITNFISPTCRTEGTLPVAALVDGRIISDEDRVHPKYRMRWYAPKSK